jgi:hypothetical protein
MSDVIIGWDVSTTAIGVCMTKEGLSSFHVIFPEGDSAESKHRHAAGCVSDLLTGFSLDPCRTTHVVEDRLQGFTKGLTTMHTILSLTAMNAVVSYVLSSFGRVLKVHPSTVKSFFGLRPPKDVTLKKLYNPKEAAVKLVMERVSNFPCDRTKGGNLSKGVSDMADAWILAEFGRCFPAGKVNVGHSKKTRTHKRKARRSREQRREKV